MQAVFLEIIKYLANFSTKKTDSLNFSMFYESCCKVALIECKKIKIINVGSF